MVTRKPIWQLF